MTATGNDTTKEAATTPLLRKLPPDDPIQRVRARKSKIAIVGFTEHRKQALELDPDEWALWGLNELYRYMPIERFDLWCEIHDWDGLATETDDQVPPPWPRHVEVMANGFDKHPAFRDGWPIPIYMQDARPDVKNSHRFPKEAVEADLQGNYGEYKTSAPAWMMGLAIAAGFEEIRLYGIDMATDCLAPGTRVLTAGLRWVPIEDIRVGDTLLTFDEEPQQYNPNKKTKHRRWRTSKVLYTEDRPRPSCRVKLANGEEFVTSEGHKWLCRTSGTHIWRRTDEMTRGPERGRGGHNYKRQSQVTKVLDTWDDDWTRETGYLAAAFDGEGHIRNPATRGGLGLHFGQRDNAMLATVKRYLGGLGFQYSEREGHSRDGDGVATATKVKGLGLLGGVAEKLRFLGQVRPHRLLDKLDLNQLGMLQAKEHVAVESVEPIGEQRTIGLKTEAGTIIAEGYAQHNTEYAEQRPCMEFLSGVALGRGIAVKVPETSDLMASVGQYAFGSGDAFTKKIIEREEWLLDQLKQHRSLHGQIEDAYAKKRAELDELHRVEKSRVEGKVHEILGQLQNTRYMRRAWAVPVADAAGPHPDRTADPRTGIDAGDAEAMAVAGNGMPAGAPSLAAGAPAGPQSTAPATAQPGRPTPLAVEAAD